MKKKVALLLSIILCFSVFSTFSITAASDEVTYQVGGDAAEQMALTDAFTKANTLTAGKTATITLLKDVTCNKAFTYEGAGTLTIDGNGKTINTTLTGSGWISSFVMKSADATLTIENLTLINTGSHETATSNSVVRAEAGTVNVTNCNFETGFILFYANMGANGVSATINVNGGTYISSFVKGNGALLHTKDISSANGNSVTSNISVSNATLIATGVNTANRPIFLARRAAGGGDTVAFTNTNIYAPNYNGFLWIRASGTTATFDGCNIYLPSTTLETAVAWDNGGTKPTTWTNTSIVGGHYTSALLASGVYGSSQGMARAINSEGTQTAFELPDLKAESSVRIDLAGIRFRTIVEKDWDTKYQNAALYLKSASNTATTATVTYGTIVTLQERLDAIGISSANMTANANMKGYNISKELLDIFGIKYLDIVATEQGTTENDTEIEYRAAVTDITEGWYDTKLATISYAKVTVGDEVFYFYSDFNPANNTHNMKDVATQLLAKYNAAPEDYSYTPQDIARLKEYAGVTEG